MLGVGEYGLGLCLHMIRCILCWKLNLTRMALT